MPALVGSSARPARGLPLLAIVGYPYATRRALQCQSIDQNASLTKPRGESKMSKRLEEILRAKQRKQKESQIDHQKVREEWVSCCATLVAQISDWLAPLQIQQLLDTHAEKIVIFEEQLGEYEVDSLRIVFLESDVLKIKPIARFIIGAKGRIDILAGGTSLTMLLATESGDWLFAKRNIQLGKYETWPFNKDTFDEFLSQFLEE